MLALRTIYTSKFVKIYPDNQQLEVAAKLWCRELQEFSDEVIDEALKETINRFDWPPGISEFKQLCKTFIPSARYPEWTEIQKLPSPPKGDPVMKEEIELGSIFCKRLKEIYPDENWTRIVYLFGKFKNKIKKFYPTHSETEFLTGLASYSNEDIYEILEGHKHGKDGDVETILHGEPL